MCIRDSFEDVPENHWAYEAVKQLAAYGLIQGFPDGTYKGQEPMTRYQMAIVVARLLSDLDTEIIELRNAIESGLEAEQTARAEDRAAIDLSLIHILYRVRTRTRSHACGPRRPNRIYR